jgi:hypothetical protein
MQTVSKRVLSQVQYEYTVQLKGWMVHMDQLRSFQRFLRQRTSQKDWNRRIRFVTYIIICIRCHHVVASSFVNVIKYGYGECNGIG